MSSQIAFAGVQKKGRVPQPIASRATNTMFPGNEDRSRERRRATGEQERAVRRSSGARQLITFVDSQDPNSRSTIQRHTAHHSNAQRRDARLQSLRNTSRPRVLQWTRRESTEAASVASPASSHSSSSISPLPPTTQPSGLRSAGEEPSNSPLTTSEPGTTHLPSLSLDRASPSRELAITHRKTNQNLLNGLLPRSDACANSITVLETLCRHASDRVACEDIVSFARTDEACMNLLLAYSISSQQHNGSIARAEVDHDTARSHLQRGTSLLRERLSDPLTASADVNIQAVLLLIAYTADYGSFDLVRIHANALRTMIDQRRDSGEENYPPIISRQLRTIHDSRFYHLTLDCSEPCTVPKRFPHGLYSV